MAGVTRFEELAAWQEARVLAREVHVATRQRAFARDFGLAGQMQHAAVPIMSNIAEGFERARSGEFHQFLSMAKGSCGELHSQPYIALDAGYLAQAGFERLQSSAEEVARIIGRLRSVTEYKRDQQRGRAPDFTQNAALSPPRCAGGTQHSPNGRPAHG